MREMGLCYKPLSEQSNGDSGSFVIVFSFVGDIRDLFHLEFYLEFIK